MAAAACLTTIGGAAVFGSTSAAQTSARPTVTGSPVIGGVLTSSSGATGHTLYQWQSCDPATSDCSDTETFSDPNWFVISSQTHTNTTYTVQPSDAGHYIRVATHDNTLGDKWVTSAPVGPVPIPPPPPAPPAQEQAPPPLEPEHGISLLVEPAGGSVHVKAPGQNGFSDLDKLEKIPVDSVVDTRGGRVKVVGAVGDLGNTTEDNSVFFYSGLIRLEQSGNTNAPTVARLIQKLRCGKNAGASASAASGPVASASKAGGRRVWGSGSGSYGSRGSGGTGSVRGTTWLTKDTCRGTFFKVTEGIGISVFDFDLGKSVELGPGQSYFARNR